MKTNKDSDDQQGIEADVQMITPTVAAAYLGTQRDNRPLSRGKVAEYAQAMTAGDWMVTGEAIKFDTDRALIDGQHRLEAIIKSGKTVPMMVIRGLATRAQVYMDRNKMRSVGDVLALNGEKNFHALGGALVRLKMHNQGDTGKQMALLGHRGFPPADALDMLERFPDMRDSVGAITSKKTVIRLVGHAMAGCAHYLFNQRDPVANESFWNQFETGTMLTSESPVLHLRNRLSDNLRDNTRLTEYAKTALVFRAFRHHRLEHPIKYLVSVTGPGDKFPDY